MSEIKPLTKSQLIDRLAILESKNKNLEAALEREARKEKNSTSEGIAEEVEKANMRSKRFIELSFSTAWDGADDHITQALMQLDSLKQDIVTGCDKVQIEELQRDMRRQRNEWFLKLREIQEEVIRERALESESTLCRVLR